MFLSVIEIDPQKTEAARDAILKAWPKCRVLHIRAPNLDREDVHGFYDRLLPKIGTPHLLAEDVKVGDRNVQRSGEIWMEVRYVPGCRRRLPPLGQRTTASH